MYIYTIKYLTILDFPIPYFGNRKYSKYTSNGSSHHFPNTEYLVVFIKTNILQHIQKRRTLVCKDQHSPTYPKT